MKTLITLTLLAASLNSMAAGTESKNPTASELKLRGCISMVYQNAAGSRSESKDTIKQVNNGVKACKDEVKAMVKAEKDAAKKNKILEAIKKLQSKLKA